MKKIITVAAMAFLVVACGPKKVSDSQFSEITGKIQSAIETLKTAPSAEAITDAGNQMQTEVQNFTKQLGDAVLSKEQTAKIDSLKSVFTNAAKSKTDELVAAAAAAAAAVDSTANAAVDAVKK